MEEIKSWIDSGADVNFRNHLGFTALMGSAIRGDFDMVKLLVTHGAHISIKDNKHYCALHYATIHNHIKIIKYLVENGAIVNDNIYMTAIHKEYKEISIYFDTLDKSKIILNEVPNDYSKTSKKVNKRRG